MALGLALRWGWGWGLELWFGWRGFGCTPRASLLEQRLCVPGPWLAWPDNGLAGHLRTGLASPGLALAAWPGWPPRGVSSSRTSAAGHRGARRCRTAEEARVDVFQPPPLLAQMPTQLRSDSPPREPARPALPPSLSPPPPLPLQPPRRRRTARSALCPPRPTPGGPALSGRKTGAFDGGCHPAAGPCGQLLPMLRVLQRRPPHTAQPSSWTSTTTASTISTISSTMICDSRLSVQFWSAA